MKRLLAGAIALLILSAVNAAAATLNFVGAGQTHDVTRNDIQPAFNTEIDIITGDQKTYSNGLFLDASGGAADVTYTFLGAEAGNRNFSAIFGGGTFFNRGGAASTPGDQITVRQETSGLLDFAFGTYSPLRAIGVFFNDGLAYPGSSNFAMGFIQIDVNSFYVLFDDIARGDRDFDDMAIRIDVAAVPIPAGGLLLLSALAGALVLRRKSNIA
ncbi:VPLPA-CTERM sorting domain-containing protein [Cognatiyoonia sp. IB215446]|uniref:VPLPA-CTERM sorting domain-containing protein n=1 Tax=Cognatiyoonia sp. IB215446 TaxID=3097355 RepID=UPI002A12C274|nr:VPLPA-CTERM sorting domain-containing protein [Cognatiyoonia sp. IB215446]MDX8349222.1 VPLPA-CTERM sorting domain-containing protein [Cognatiyoonia sp. IB215446]